MAKRDRRTFTDQAGKTARVQLPPDGYVALVGPDGENMGVAREFLTDQPQIALDQLDEARREHCPVCGQRYEVIERSVAEVGRGESRNDRDLGDLSYGAPLYVCPSHHTWVIDAETDRPVLVTAIGGER